jgi:hypothetical protein
MASNLCIAVGEGGNSIATSTDSGLTWTGQGTTMFSTSGNGVAGPATYDVSTVSFNNGWIAYNTKLYGSINGGNTFSSISSVST